MNNTYGYIRGTEGVDGDHIDVFLSDNPASGKVWVIDQVKPDGSFDEHKVMYGFVNAMDATNAYLSNYSEGWQGLGAISGISREEFKKWVESSHRKTKPFREYALAKSAEAKKAAQPKEHKRIVSDDKMEELRKQLLAKFNDLNEGIDVERMLLGAMYAVGKIERGVTKFADYAAQMVDEIGDAIRPYLKAFYEAVRNMPEAAAYRDLMDSPDYVAKFDEYNFDKADKTPTAIVKAEQVVKKQKAKQQVKKIEKEVNQKLQQGDLFADMFEEQQPEVKQKPTQKIQFRNRKLDASEFKGIDAGKRFQTPDGTVEIARVDYDRLVVWDIDKNGNRSNETRSINTVDIIDGLKTGVVTPVEKPTKPKQPVLRKAVPADLDENNPVVYYQGHPWSIIAIVRKGEQVSATKFSEPTIESVVLTNGKSVPFSELMVEDKNAKPAEKKKSAWWYDPNRPASLDPSDYTTYMTDEAKAYFAQFKSEDGKTDFTKWAHPNLAYITAATWDGAEIPYEELKVIPEIANAEKEIKNSLSNGVLEISDQEVKELAQKLVNSTEAKQERKALVIIGLPAGGKSSVFANPLSKQYGARIIDSDDVKPWLKGFDDGNGAGYVHEASAKVAEKAIDIAVGNGDNIIIPRIGGKSVMELSAALRLAGYDVQLYFNDVKGVTSINRAASRFAQTGRYLSLDYLTEKAGVPTENFVNFAENTIGGYLNERTEKELQNVRRRLQGLLGELDGSREGLWQSLAAKRSGEGTSKRAVQDAMGSRELQDGRDELSVLLNSPLFTYAEWKSNDVAFGEKPKEIWNSESGTPLSDVLKKNDNGKHAGRLPEKSGEAGEGTSQTSGATDGAGTAPSSEQNRTERPGFTNPVTQQPAKPKQELHNNKRNNQGERGKDYAPTSVKARFNANVEAIKLMRALVDDGVEAPTKDQMEVLRQYSGWGGMGTYFNDESSAENKILRDILTDEEYNTAVMSINSAYYTPAMVIDSMWDIAKALGFKGGNVLEGSAGIGNIIGQMPQDMSRRSNIEAVEIDEISGNILKLLYPDAKVHIQGFQDTVIPNGSVDLAITNVPFVTGLRVFDKVDKDLSRRFTNIHDFCIAKNVRKLKEGGIGIFISSSGTLDKSTDIRAWITDDGQSDVIGAFRLNNETFGGTNATSDIIVVRKRTNGKKSEHAIDIAKASPIRIGSWEDKYGDEHQASLVVNDYFKGHPDMMAGEMFFGYEKGDTFRPGSYGLYPVAGKNQEKMLNDFVKSMESAKETIKLTNEPAKPVENQLTAVKEGRMLIDDNGRLCVSRLGVAVPLGINDQKVKGQTKQQCFKDYQAVQAAVDDVLQQQLSSPDDAALQPKLDALNKAWDNFVKRYGVPYKNTSLAFLRNDIDFPSFVALSDYVETKDMKGKVTITSKKSPLFSKRVLGFKTEPKPKTVKDAVIASIFRSNGIDLDWIAAKLSEVAAPPNGDHWTADDVRKGVLVSRLGFENPSTGQLEVRHQYLSGNVREKLAIAEAYNTDGKYSANVEELRKVVPMDIPAHLIDFSLGSSWIPFELYTDFIKNELGLDNVKLGHIQGRWTMDLNEWTAKRSETNKAKGVYSEKFHTHILGSDLVLSALNNRPYKVARQETMGWGSNQTKRTVVDQEATQACNVRIEELKDAFKQYIRKRVQDDVDLARSIEKIYNDKFNALVPLHVDDDMLPEKFDNANTTIELYNHQKRGVMRGIVSPTMLAHEVGTGKSFTLITTAMEMRRLGTAKKPMLVVQNATVAQMTADAKLLYPNAKVLTLSEQDRDAEGRRAFYAKIRYNDWDLIIIPQSTLDRIPDSPERELQFIQEQIDEKKHLIEQARAEGLDRREIERMERELMKKEQEYGDKSLDSDPANASNSPKRKKKDAKREAAALDKAETKAQEKLDRATDDVQFFDDLGVDAILVDEAHGYKHLGFETSLGRSVKGVDPSYSKKCAGLYNKTRSVFEKAGWKNVVFATGTPISNTAAEIWTFMKYLMPADMMKENDIYYFDDFVHNFGSINQMLEFKTNGKFNEVTRFAAYVNRPELMRIWMQVADIVRTTEVKAVKDKVPEKENGKDQDVFLPQSPSLVNIMSAVRAELERFENMDGKQKKENSSIPLTMYGIAKRAAIDPRLVNPDAPDEPLSKTNAAVKEIVKDLQATKKYNGTVAVFCDNQNRLGENGVVEFNIFDDIKDKLIKQGVPEKQISVIKSNMSINAKQKIFDAVNKGEVRVIMGSTQTLGTGVNIQERLHCLIHMDAPDRPMDYTQRNGRIERQGNLHKDWGLPIRILRFGVEDSLDVTAYQRLKTKSGFIDSIMNGKDALANNQTDRTIEEEEEGLFDNPVAVLSGSQFALKKNQAERELRRLQGKRSAWEADQIYVSSQLRANESWIADRQRVIAESQQELERIRGMFPDGKVKTINVDGTSVDMTAEDADKKLTTAIKEKINDPVNATVKKLRENDFYNDETLSFTIELDGQPIKFDIDVFRTSEWEGGKMRTSLHKRTHYNSAPLQLKDGTGGAGTTKGVKECLDEILTDFISGKKFTDTIENAKSSIERTEDANAQLKEREGQPFQFTNELEEAYKRVDEYTAAMKKELEEKEAKYKAAQDEAKEKGDFDLNKAADSEDDEIRYRNAEDWDEAIFRPMDVFGDGESFPIHVSHSYSDTDILNRTTSYSADLMPDEYGSEQQLLDAVRNQYPAYYASIEDGNVVMRNWKNVMAEAKNATKPAKGKESYIERKTRNAINAVKGLAEQMHLDVEVLTSTDGLTEKQKRSRGWFNPKTGKITLVLPNHSNRDDLINTLLHEGVAHAGLRKMFGVHFATFLDNVYNNVSPEIKARIDAAMKRNKWGRHEATEEYLARLAERTDFEHAEKQGWWQKIKDFFMKMLAKVGLAMEEPLSDNELRYILWRSYDNLLHPGRRTIFDKAREVQMQNQLKVGPYSEQQKRVAQAEEEISVAAARVSEDVEEKPHFTYYTKEQAKEVLNILQQKYPAAVPVSVLTKDSSDIDVVRAVMGDTTPNGLDISVLATAGFEDRLKALADSLRDFLGKKMAGGYVPIVKKIIIFADRTPAKAYEEVYFHENIHAILDEWYGGPDEDNQPRRGLCDRFWNDAPGWINGTSKKDIEDVYVGKEYSWPEEYFAFCVSRCMVSGHLHLIDEGLKDNADEQRLDNILNRLGYDRATETKARRGKERREILETSESWQGNDDQRRLSGDESEIEEIIAHAKANGTYMLAPNGKPSNLNERQWAQVRTMAFINWFGDWEFDPEDASQVVDENGEPKVMYHKTNLDVVNKGVPFYTFYEDSHFGTKGQANDRVRSEEGAKMYEVFLNIRNPQRRPDANEDYLEDKDMTMTEYWQLMAERSKSQGHDGIVYLNEYEDKEHPADSWIAFSPNQIKSATENSGDFSTEDDDIRYSIRTKEAPKKTGTGYKVFVLKNGELYPPMVANPNGEGTPVGRWLDADAAPIIGESKTGRPKVKAGGKGTQGGSGELAYRPGWHLGTIPYALQFGRKDADGNRTLFPNNFVWAEVDYADDVDYQQEAHDEGVTANGKYQHSLAGLKHVPTDGSYKYRTNPNPETDEWIITGAMRVKRILTRAEVDELVRKAGREPQKIQDGDTVTDEEVKKLNKEIKATIEADEMGLLYRDDSAWEDDIARGVYERAVAQDGIKMKEAWQDSMVALKLIQNAIAKETGRVATGAEDAYLFENRMHGKAKNMSEQYDWRFYRPMLKAFADFCKAHGYSQEQGLDYLISKSGLERNMYYAMQSALKEQVTERVKAEREKLEKEYAKNRITETEYKVRKSQIDELERTGVDDAIKELKDKFVWQKAKEEYENGNIDYTEYLRRLETIILHNAPKYDEYANDYSGLTETFAKEWYDDAQDTKRAAQRAVDPKERRALWSQYNKEMKQAYQMARQFAEDAVFSAEDSDKALSDDLWKKIKAATGETLKHSYETGMMERKTYDKVRGMFDYYIPLRGWDEDKASDVYTYMGKDNVFSPAVKKAWGRTSKAENPLAYIGNIAISTILAGHRNQMKQHFLNYVMNNPTSLVSLSESWYENVGDEDNPMWILRSADTAGKSGDEIAQIVNDFNEEMQAKQREGKAMPVTGRLRLDVHATKGQKSEHVVEVQRAGHTYQMYINGNPKAAQALNGSAARAVSRISQTWLGQKITNLNRSMAMFFTSKNPAFVISNLSRDLNMAGASVAINEGAAYNARFIANVAKVLRPQMGESSKWMPASKQPTGLMPSLLRKWKNGTLDTSDETERLFKEFMDEGGETGFVNMLSIDSFKEKMRKEIAEMNGSSLFGKGVKETTIHKALRMLGDTFEFYNRCAEDATRFIVYMTSRQMGKTMEQSIADAKDVTLNFNRKGTGDKGNAELRDLFIFVNPAIQALANMYRMAKGHPLKFGAVTAAFVVGGALMPILNQWFLNMFGDDDDKDAYWNLPPWVRKNNLVFWVPGTKNFVTVPLAQEFRVFYGVGEMVTSAVMEHPVDKLGLEVFSSVADLVPINPTGNGGNLMVDFAPTMVQPLMQIGENVDFTGKPIWRENQGNKYAPMYTKAYVSTPKMMVAISEALNMATGGNEGKKGWIERSTAGEYLNNPAVWNHLLQGYFGGMYNTIAKTVDVGFTLGSGELPKIYQTPIINRFLNRPVERDNAGVLGDEYYGLKDQGEALKYEMRVWRKKAADGEPGAQEHVEEIENSNEWKRLEVVSHYDKIIQDLKAGEKATTDKEEKDSIKSGISLYKQQMMEELAALDDGKESLDAAMEQYDKAKTMAEKKQLKLRIERLVRGEGKKTATSREQVDKAISYLRDADEDNVGSDRYLELSTADIVKADAAIKTAKAKAKTFTDHYKQLMDKGMTAEAATYRADNAKWFAAAQAIGSHERAISGNKKLLGKGNDDAIMKIIASHRNAMLNIIKDLEDSDE